MLNLDFIQLSKKKPFSATLFYGFGTGWQNTLINVHGDQSSASLYEKAVENSIERKRVKENCVGSVAPTASIINPNVRLDICLSIVARWSEKLWLITAPLTAQQLVPPPLSDSKRNSFVRRTEREQGNPHAKFTISRLWRVSGRK